MRWKGESYIQQIGCICEYVGFFDCCLVLSRLINSKPQSLSPKPSSLSGPVDQQSPQAKQALPSLFDWKSFLSSPQEERLKTDSSCLNMIEAEQGELFEAIRRALQSLRKHKVSINNCRKLSANYYSILN